MGVRRYVCGPENRQVHHEVWGLEPAGERSYVGLDYGEAPRSGDWTPLRLIPLNHLFFPSSLQVSSVYSVSPLLCNPTYANLS